MNTLDKPPLPRILRLWLTTAGIVLALVLILGLIWPWVEKRRAINFLTNAGFMWNEEKAEVVAATAEARRIERLDPLVGAFHRLNPKSLNLSFCAALQKVDALKGRIGLQNLGLSICTALPKESWLPLQAALPKTRITFPDGSKAIPTEKK